MKQEYEKPTRYTGCILTKKIKVETINYYKWGTEQADCHS